MSLTCSRLLQGCYQILKSILRKFVFLASSVGQVVCLSLVCSLMCAGVLDSIPGAGKLDVGLHPSSVGDVCTSLYVVGDRYRIPGA